ncbi:MlaD family protein [Nocardia halotolerans]|uniref:MlaD family protein n=1 Tax=Nocardia halotolerans TaxID=1755878 RepID=A0ABV8VBU2_9NOCA
MRRLLARRSARVGDLGWGIAGVCGAVLLTIALGVVAVVGTSAEREYAADLAHAGALREGDDIRIAGITVGQVRSLTLLPDRVRMAFTVREEVFLGDRTMLDIRMLTVVGGYYVAVQPAGDTPLGSAVIPEERVILPYNLTQVFQDAVRPVREIDGTVLRQNLAALSGSIDESPDAFRSALRAAGDLVAVMNEQNADISRALAVADEYLTAVNGSSAVLAQLVRMLHTLETLVQTNKASVSQALGDLADVLHKVSPLGRAWDRDLRERAQPLADAVGKLDALATHLGSLFDAVRALEQRLLPLLTVDGVHIDRSAVTIVPERICVPVPGGGC